MMMSGEGEGKVVCVTGASGFVASWLVKLLLQRGYTVNATVREPNSPKTKQLGELDGAKERLHLFKANLLEEGSFDSAVDRCDGVFHTASLVVFSSNNPQNLIELTSPDIMCTVDSPKTEHLRELDGAKERLYLFKANLLEEGSFDSAVDGCDGVFHTACPVIFSSDNPQADVVDPAVKGSLNVLRSCAKVHSIKRVVLTSSIAAMLLNETPLTPDVVIDETWFSNPVFCKENKMWYPLAKTLAEEAAWKFAKENGIDLVVINPGIVIGPFFQPILNFGAEVILNLMKNGDQSIIFPYAFVDIRDVAYAHIRALEVPKATGRYLLIGSITQRSDILEFLREHYPTLLLSGKLEEKNQPTIKFSQEKAKGLGINLTHWEVGARGSIESLMEKGFLS